MLAKRSCHDKTQLCLKKATQKKEKKNRSIF